MVRVSKFRRPNGFLYVRYWIGSDPVDESARTKSEIDAERYRVRRDVEINAGIQPIKHSDLDSLIMQYHESLPPGTSASHRHESKRILRGFLEICGRRRRDGTYRLSRFVFDGLVFDSEYFRQKMIEHRERARQRLERVRALLAQSRSRSLLPGPLDLSVSPGLLDALNGRENSRGWTYWQ